MTEQIPQSKQPGAVARLFHSSGAPWQTSFAIHIAIGLVVGAAVCLLFAGPIAAVLGGLCAGLTAGIAARVPATLATVAAILAAVAIVFGGTLGVLTSTIPWAAALALALVIVASSLAAGTGPLGAGLGLVASFAFVFAASVRVLGGDRAGSLAAMLLVTLVGAGTGVVVAVASGLIRAHGKQSLPPAAEESMAVQMARSVRTGDKHLRDGIRRAIPLALAVMVFSALGGRDAYWVLLSAFSILLPAGKPPLAITATRIAGTVLGVVATGILALVLPTPVLAAIAISALLVGIACQERYAVVGAALSSLGAIMTVGLPSGAVTAWAAHRLIDTLIGSAIALAAVLLLWPRDTPTQDPALAAPVT
jgi:hypothetical protein